MSSVRLILLVLRVMMMSLAIMIFALIMAGSGIHVKGKIRRAYKRNLIDNYSVSQWSQGISFFGVHVGGDELTGVWGQMFIGSITFSMAVASFIMGFLIFGYNRTLPRFQPVLMAVGAIICLLFTGVEFYYGCGFLGDRMNKILREQPHVLKNLRAKLANRVDFLRFMTREEGGENKRDIWIHCSSWITAAVFLLFSSICYAVDAFMSLSRLRREVKVSIKQKTSRHGRNVNAVSK
ncbi:hypothetical protein L596_028838 [Steinernema carpocapsae]|uniref:MARVEL domain-containing protein n=1 Tax=Steinernema carpocapsae TaxID=34508 RepID=A0A4U5M0L2_STECR|nr:hypothetical protein L596_028838 [Steinernema carpocapsae]